MCFCGLEMGRRASRKDRQSANRACEMLPGAHNLSLGKLKLRPSIILFVSMILRERPPEIFTFEIR